MKIDHKDIFRESCLEKIILNFLGIKITIPESELSRKSNESQHKKAIDIERKSWFLFSWLKFFYQSQKEFLHSNNCIFSFLKRS